MKDDLKPVLVGDVIVVTPSKDPRPLGSVWWRAKFIGKARKAEEDLLRKIKNQTASPLAHALLDAHKFTSMDNEVRRGLWSWFDAEGRMAIRESAVRSLLAAIGDCADRRELAERLAMACKEVETGCPPAQGGPVFVQLKGKPKWILLEAAVFETTKRLARENGSRGIFNPPTRDDITKDIASRCIFRRGQNEVVKPGRTKWDESFEECGLGSLRWQKRVSALKAKSG